MTTRSPSCQTTQNRIENRSSGFAIFGPSDTSDSFIDARFGLAVNNFLIARVDDRSFPAPPAPCLRQASPCSLHRVVSATNAGTSLGRILMRHIRRAARPQLVVGILELKPHGHRARILIDVRIDKRQFAVEHSSGKTAS